MTIWWWIGFIAKMVWLTIVGLGIIKIILDSRR